MQIRQTVRRNGTVKTIITDTIDPFKGLCPVCGGKLIHRVIKKANGCFKEA